MAVDEGFNRYQCDVKTCTKRGYLKPGSQGASEYVECQYLDANNQTRTPVLCQKHAAMLTKLKQQHDSEYDSFITTGTLPTTTSTTTESDA